MDRRLFLKGVVPHRCTTIANTAQTPDLRIAYGGIGIECSTYSRADDRARQEVRMNAPPGPRSHTSAIRPSALAVRAAV
jgi:hypothetical protein